MGKSVFDDAFEIVERITLTEESLKLTFHNPTELGNYVILFLPTVTSAKSVANNKIYHNSVTFIRYSATSNLRVNASFVWTRNGNGDYWGLSVSYNESNTEVTIAAGSGLVYFPEGEAIVIKIKS